MQPDLIDDIIAFDRMEITLLGAVYTLQSDTMISMFNAREFLNYKLELSKLHALHVLASNEPQDLVLQGKAITGVVIVKVVSNKVACDLSFSLTAAHDTLIEPICSVLLLDSGRRVDGEPVSGFTLKGVLDKNLAIVLKFKFPILPETEKRIVGKLNLEGVFTRTSDTILKKSESSLSLANPRSLEFTYRSFSDVLAIEMENQLTSALKIDSLTIAGQQTVANQMLESSEVFSACHDNSIAKAQKVPMQLIYSIPKDQVVLNPALKSIHSDIFTKLAIEPEFSIASQQSLDIDLVQPLCNTAFRVVVTAPSETDLHSTFKVKVDLAALKPGIACLIQMSDRNLENMLIVDKNSVLCDFRKLASSQTSIDIEILPLKTGYLKVPEILVLPVDSSRHEESRAMVEVRNAFVKVATAHEVSCVHTNNFFNDKVQEV